MFLVLISSLHRDLSTQAQIESSKTQVFFQDLSNRTRGIRTLRTSFKSSISHCTMEASNQILSLIQLIKTAGLQLMNQGIAVVDLQ